MSSNGTSATDVITYIGVPLAVLGVLPILYNTTATLITLSKVKHLLRASRLAGTARGDVINHVIEVELPRFTIAPIDREDCHEKYWNTYEHPSLIRGGSWTMFNWRLHTIGTKTQRIEYADQLRQPQAEINFQELLSYLLDLGAVPNAAGFRLLRTAGLWIPTGTPLLLSPAGDESVLSIAPLDDSDGHLSLSVHWSTSWRTRDLSSLPPYWIRIYGPTKNTRSKPAAEVSAHMKLDHPLLQPAADRSKASSLADVSVVDDLKQDCTPATSIRCHISLDGLADAMEEDPRCKRLEQIDVSHLGIRFPTATTAGTWFASASTALAAINHGALWSYEVPNHIKELSKTEAISCGILVLLGIVEESSTPEWATKYDDNAEEHDAMMRRLREQSMAAMRQSRLSPDQRAAAESERQHKSVQDWHEEQRSKSRRLTQRAEQRTLEALQSVKWSAGLVADNNLKWLQKCGYIPQSYDILRAVEVLLYRMIKEQDFADVLAQMLDAWKIWVNLGGMKRADYIMLKDKQEMFAYASLIIVAICDSTSAIDGSLAMDLQESARTWKRVRLG
ncbi:MAG: hypothetical protein M1818_001103 [Claussenomyces sp. TS43310]|nr:MAG: hypothetical protein M1818_001103 [Claussenomyces sp. TS43310]